VADEVDVFLAQYKDAAGEGAVLELRLRLLADKVPALDYDVDDRFFDIESKVIAHFAASLAAEECDVLRQCRQLRNKIMHADFHQARKQLQQLGAPALRGGVRRIDIAGLSGPALPEKLIAAASGDPGSFTHVSDLNSTAAGGVFGWLLELGNAGDFYNASTVFKRASLIVDRLCDVPDQLAMGAGT
jgi:hypothetical protein